MKIGLVQLEALSENLTFNQENILNFLDQGIKEELDLICFPEMALCGYSMDNIKEREILQRPILKNILEVTSKNNITISIGGIEKSKGSNKDYYITQYVVSDNIYGYRKTHLGEKERLFFKEGDFIPNFNVNNTKFGIMTCYDSHFPEFATQLSLSGANFILNPSASSNASEKRLSIWDKYLGARAYDNRVWVMATNLCFNNKGGGIAVYDSDGNKVADYSGSDNHMISFEFKEKKYEALSRINRNFNSHRRSDLYNRNRCINGMITYGYTTGSTAAAAGKIVTKTLFSGTKVESIDIDTPKGWPLIVKANYTHVTKDKVECFTVKNHSDDPDVTKGIRIYASARKVSDPGIFIKTGKGIGIVTKKGLSVPVGKPAINPVPMEMIITEIEKVLPEDAGVEVTFTIPEGVEIAKKTFNSNLGIIGGISILGTTGVVEPMSEDAFKESLKLEMSVEINNSSRDTLIFVFGNFGNDFLKKYHIPEAVIIKTSNFIGYMMEAAGDLGVKKVLLVGHAGKMVKVAKNMYNTHSKYGDNRMESIVASCYGISDSNKDKVLNCNTTDEAVSLLKDLKKDIQVFKDIGKRCKKNCEEWSKGKVKVETLIFTTEYGELSFSETGKNWLKEFYK